MKIKIDTLTVQIIRKKETTVIVMDESVVEGATLKGTVDLKMPKLGIFCKIIVDDFSLEPGAIYLDNMQTQTWQAISSTEALLRTHDEDTFHNPESLTLIKKSFPEA